MCARIFFYLLAGDIAAF